MLCKGFLIQPRALFFKSLFRNEKALCSTTSTSTKTSTTSTTTVGTGYGSFPILKVYSRDMDGSRNARYLRKLGRIPGVLYGQDDLKKVLKTNIIIDQKVLMKQLRETGKSFENTLYELHIYPERDDHIGLPKKNLPKYRWARQPTTEEMESAKNEESSPATVTATEANTNTEGDTETEGVSEAPEGDSNSEDCFSESDIIAKFVVTPRQTQFSAMTDQPISVNFLKYKPGNRIKVPFAFSGHEENSELKKAGAYLLYVNRTVEVECKAEIPKNFPVDVSVLTAAKSVIRLQDLTLPLGVRPTTRTNNDYVLCTLKVGRTDVEKAVATPAKAAAGKAAGGKK